MLAETNRSRRLGRMAFAALLLTALPLLAQYDPKLQYQDRGDRREGLKPKPVSGNDVELLSALVDYREEGGSGWSPALHLRFVLPAAGPVSITVRQPRPKTLYYWLDEVVPRLPWRPRAVNEYTWPTEPVLQKLSAVTLEDLGAVVRLSTAKGPSKQERVAPAALFQTQPPTAASGYRFTFKTNGTAYVTGKIYRGDQKVFERQQNRETAGSPFTLSWPAQGQPDGEYRLVLSGFFDNTNDQLAQEVVFYHRASWK